MLRHIFHTGMVRQRKGPEISSGTTAQVAREFSGVPSLSLNGIMFGKLRLPGVLKRTANARCR
ncbi:putative dNA and RNA helicase [Brucella suis 1330]|nr:putative dNA and RNA helicase [Brucella suis 1330]